jgi:hypothetical protein
MRKLLFGLVCLLALLPFAAVGAQELTPSVTVSDQFIAGSTVRIDEVVSAAEGFIVIHIDNGGSPGPVAGFAAVAPGVNSNVWVSIDTSMATPVMFAMLHEDTGVVGTYEFGTVEGADGPVRVNDQVVTPPFNAVIIDSINQFVMGDTVTVGSITTPVDGFLVIHSGVDGRPGPVLGFTPVTAGTTADVAVTLAAEGRTDAVWPMLHVDDNTIGTYEFGTVEGADGPVRAGGAVATTPFWTVPHISAGSQVVTLGDNGGVMMEGTPSVHINNVLSEGPGWVVIHIDNEGAPGPVAGFVAVPAGASGAVDIPLDAEGVTITPVLWPMLHVDTGEAGVYEFGTVEGADGPVRVNDQVVTFPINAAPSLMLSAQALGEGGTLVINQAVIDAPGWIAIHTDNEGAPGPVIGTVWIPAGVSNNVTVTLDDPSMAGAQVFPMLHYDTGVAGEYEFGTVEGADAPVFVGENVIFAPLPLTS